MITGKHGFQRRYMVVMMLTLGSILSYTMIHSATLTTSKLLDCCINYNYNNDSNLCPAGKRLVESFQNALREHHFLECAANEKALMIGYSISHIPGGAISDLYGGKHLIGLSILMSSIVVSLLPVILRHYRVWLMITLNLLVGLLTGVSKSASVSLLAHWLPKHEQAYLGCIYFSGEILGALLGAQIFISLLKSVNWQLFFYFWSALGLLYYITFLTVVYASARADPHVSRAEEGLLRKGVHFPSRIPWRKILKDEAVWAIFAAQVGHNFVGHLVFEILPDYLMYQVGTDVKRIELILVPRLCLVVLAIAGGYLADQKVRKQFIPVGYLRCFYIVFGNLVPVIFAMTIRIFWCNYYATAAVYSLSIMASGPIYAGAHMNTFDLTHHYTGTVYGLTKGPAGVFNIIASLMFRYISREHFDIAYMCMVLMDLMLGICMVLLYFIWMHGERASWDLID